MRVLLLCTSNELVHHEPVGEWAELEVPSKWWCTHCRNVPRLFLQSVLARLESPQHVRETGTTVVLGMLYEGKPVLLLLLYFDV